MYSSIILLIILTIGIIIKINSLAIAAAFLLLLRLLNLHFVFPKIEAYGLNIGIIILTIGILTPIAADKYSLREITQSIQSPLGLLAIIGGVIVIYFTGNGYRLLLTDSSIMLPILIGTIIGMVIFKGVPVGPLVSGGITMMLYQIYQMISKGFFK